MKRNGGLSESRGVTAAAAAAVAAVGAVGVGLGLAVGWTMWGSSASSSSSSSSSGRDKRGKRTVATRQSALYVPKAFRDFGVSCEAGTLPRWVPQVDGMWMAFAVVISVEPSCGDVAVSHLPVLIRQQQQGGEQSSEAEWVVQGHLARANRAHARLLSADTAGQVCHRVVLLGPHTYVSPRFYPGDSKTVPTWNYASVHMHGKHKEVTDADAKLQAMDTLVQVAETLETAHRQESQASQGGEQDDAALEPWELGSLALPRTAGLLRAIGVFEIRVEAVQGKAKFSQNKPEHVAAAVAAAYPVSFAASSVSSQQ